MHFVLDCSVALSWFFQDETTPFTIALQRSLISATTAVVPMLWEYEMVNGLLSANRRNRIQMEDVVRSLVCIQDLPIEKDASSCISNHRVLLLADCYHLTAYDAAYLELAHRLRIPLASLDKQLIQAANDSQVPVLSQHDFS